MSESDLLLGLELGLLSITPFILAFIVLIWWRWINRHKVWVDIDLLDRAVRPKVLPKSGVLITKWGSWKIINGTGKPFRNRMMYRCASGYPYTLTWDRQNLLVELEEKKPILAADGKPELDAKGKPRFEIVKHSEYQTVVNPLPAGPSEGRISTHLKDHHFADVYANRAGITILLIFLLILAVIGILIQVVK